MERLTAYTTAKLAAYWVAKQVKPSGKFVYGYYLDTNKHVAGYNMLRHPGAIWAMLDICRHDASNLKGMGVEPNHELKEASSKALNWMIRNRVEKFAHRKVLVENGYAKIGGAGLAALALIRYYKLFGKTKYKKVAIDLCNYLVYSIEDGLFPIHKRKLSNNTGADYECSFYPGEAALALCKVNEIMSNNDFKDHAKEVIKGHFVLRESTEHIRDHWMTQAMEYFGSEFIKYGSRVTNRTMNDPVSKLAGATACRVEQLLAYRNMLSFDGDRKEMEIVSHFTNQLLERTQLCQIKDGINAGAFRKFTTTEEVRIDYAQHNICAYLRFAKEI